MNKILARLSLCLLTIFFTLKVSGQAETELQKLQRENDYLKKSLNIRDAGMKQVSSDNFSFEIVGCTGNKSGNEVNIEILITNHSEDIDIQFMPDAYSQAIDIQGNAYKADNIKVGAEKYGSTIHQDVPLKLTYSFKNINPAVALFKLITLKYFIPVKNSKHVEVQFKDIPVSWK